VCVADMEQNMHNAEKYTQLLNTNDTRRSLNMT